jgi:ABC-type multidrug transport system ATPase subunit
MNSIRTVLEDNIPALDPEVKRYIQTLIETAVEDGDGDDISQTLDEFLSEESSRQIKDIIQASTTSSSKLTTDIPELNHLADQSPPSSPELLPVCLTDTLKLDDMHESIAAAGTSKSDTSTETSPKPKSKLKQRKEERLAKKKGKGAKLSPSRTPNQNDLDLINDDHASAWKECKESNKLWGGRGHGGRGIRITGDNFEAIHLPSVSLCYEGNELLVDSKMDILKGHRYALLGRNGVGKSTLLKHIEAGNIPGLPRGLVVRMVKQQVEGRDDQTTLQSLVEADEYRSELLQEQDRIEKEMDSGINMQENAEKLAEITVELDVIDADGAEQRANDILRGLSFSSDMINSATSNLSGGWRMRLALAQALFVPFCDLLLLDEVTNHLDLHGMAWLENYLTDAKRKDMTLILVSHDRSFLDSVCTDVIVFQNKKLAYHSGNYSDYKQKMEEKAARESQILDAAERQRSKAEAKTTAAVKEVCGSKQTETSQNDQREEDGPHR